jgi:hypothetical protein
MDDKTLNLWRQIDACRRRSNRKSGKETARKLAKL